MNHVTRECETPRRRQTFYYPASTTAGVATLFPAPTTKSNQNALPAIPFMTRLCLMKNASAKSKKYFSLLRQGAKVESSPCKVKRKSTTAAIPTKEVVVEEEIL